MLSSNSRSIRDTSVWEKHPGLSTGGANLFLITLFDYAVISGLLARRFIVVIEVFLADVVDLVGNTTQTIDRPFDVLRHTRSGNAVPVNQSHQGERHRRGQVEDDTTFPTGIFLEVQGEKGFGLVLGFGLGFHLVESPVKKGVVDEKERHRTVQGIIGSDEK
jgi:hypothetical protein